jgi:hypothetical protein
MASALRACTSEMSLSISAPSIRLGSKYRLLGETAKQQAQRLREEIDRRHLQGKPIIWK